LAVAGDISFYGGTRPHVTVLTGSNYQALDSDEVIILAVQSQQFPYIFLPTASVSRRLTIICQYGTYGISLGNYGIFVSASGTDTLNGGVLAASIINNGYGIATVYTPGNGKWAVQADTVPNASLSSTISGNKTWTGSQTYSSTVVASTGFIATSSANTFTFVAIGSSTGSVIPLYVTAPSNQVQNLTNWQITGSVLASVSASGDVVMTHTGSNLVLTGDDGIRYKIHIASGTIIATAF